MGNETAPQRPHSLLSEFRKVSESRTSETTADLAHVFGRYEQLSLVRLALSWSSFVDSLGQPVVHSAASSIFHYQFGLWTFYKEIKIIKNEKIH